MLFRFGAPAGFVVCPTTACYNANYKQIMPRFGFAYQAASNISVRGGYGATSFFEGNAANQRTYRQPAARFHLLAQRNRSLRRPTGGTAYSMAADRVSPSDSSAFSANGSGYSAWPQNIQPAYIQQYNLTVETQLNSDDRALDGIRRPDRTSPDGLRQRKSVHPGPGLQDVKRC